MVIVRINSTDSTRISQSPTRPFSLLHSFLFDVACQDFLDVERLKRARCDRNIFRTLLGWGKRCRTHSWLESLVTMIVQYWIQLQLLDMPSSNMFLQEDCDRKVQDAKRQTRQDWRAWLSLYDVIWCYMTLYDVIWCYMMLYDVICMIPHNIYVPSLCSQFPVREPHPPNSMVPLLPRNKYVQAGCCSEIMYII